MARFGVPGKLLLGSDSHTPAAGSLGMLALGAGGVEVALAMAGEPLHIRMPQVWGVRLTGRLPEWTSAKDVILEMLRRHGVQGGFGRIDAPIEVKRRFALGRRLWGYGRDSRRSRVRRSA
jgi:aconitate hydratase